MTYIDYILDTGLQNLARSLAKNRENDAVYTHFSIGRFDTIDIVLVAPGSKTCEFFFFIKEEEAYDVDEVTSRVRRYWYSLVERNLRPTRCQVQCLTKHPPSTLEKALHETIEALKVIA